MYAYEDQTLRSLDVNDSNLYGRVNRTAKAASTLSKTKKQRVNTGRWTSRERCDFLRGLRLYGRGKWKKISKLIPTRSTIQVKTHAQVVLKRLQEGEDIFAELDDYEGQNQVCEEQMMDGKRYFGADEVSVASSLLLLRGDDATAQESPSSTGTAEEVSLRF